MAPYRAAVLATSNHETVRMLPTSISLRCSVCSTDLLDAVGFRLHRVHGDGETLLAVDVVEEADGAVQGGGLGDLKPRDRQDVAHQHFLEVAKLLDRFAHRENGGRAGHGVADADDGFLRNAHMAASDGGEQRRADECEYQADD